jgi:hypothetical protein
LDKIKDWVSAIGGGGDILAFTQVAYLQIIKL